MVTLGSSVVKDWGHWSVITEVVEVLLRPGVAEEEYKFLKVLEL